MSAAVFWIILPCVAAIGLLPFLRHARLVKLVGIVVSLFLTILALFQSIGDVIKLGPISINVNPSLGFFGRTLTLENPDRIALTLIFLVVLIYLTYFDVNRFPIKFIPLTLLIAGMLVAAIAVTPFLYSAVFFEIAILLMVPMVLDESNADSKGILSFVVYQSLAIPFILMSGWILGGSQASPSDQVRSYIAGFCLLVGFAFWLAVFPFHTWVSQFSRSVNPYYSGLIFSLLPIVALILMTDYVSGLIWLRESQVLGPVLRTIGIITIVTSGIWAAVEKDLRRIVAESVLFETGFALVLLSLLTTESTVAFYQAFLPRIIALFVMSFSLRGLKDAGIPLTIDGITGKIKRYPFTVTCFLLALFSVVGMPLFAGFSEKLSAFQFVSQLPGNILVWMMVGVGGFLFSALRYYSFATKPVDEDSASSEQVTQVAVLVIMTFVLLLLGAFPNLLPQLFSGLFSSLPVLQ